MNSLHKRLLNFGIAVEAQRHVGGTNIGARHPELEIAHRNLTRCDVGEQMQAFYLQTRPLFEREASEIDREIIVLKPGKSNIGFQIGHPDMIGIETPGFRPRFPPAVE